MENFQFVFQQCRSLVSVEDNLIKINVDPWMRLVTTVYYYKHRTFFRRIHITYQNITKFPDSSESQRILKTVGLPETHRITSLSEWHHLIRKTNYHAGKVTRFHEAKMIPSWNALLQHQQRATCVLQLVYNSPRLECADLENFTQYGWQLIDSSVEVVWDAPLSTTTEQSPKMVIYSLDSDISSDESDQEENEPCEAVPQSEIKEYGSDSDYEL